MILIYILFTNYLIFIYKLFLFCLSIIYFHGSYLWFIYIYIEWYHYEVSLHHVVSLLAGSSQGHRVSRCLWPLSSCIEVFFCNSFLHVLVHQSWPQGTLLLLALLILIDTLLGGNMAARFEGCYFRIQCMELILRLKIQLVAFLWTSAGLCFKLANTFPTSLQWLDVVSLEGPCPSCCPQATNSSRLWLQWLWWADTIAASCTAKPQPIGCR